ncbi:MAG: hypothetical protein IPN29_21395 [Saprospiraceae bacterium]|nr:hypothetical protein [Saprospiraceae bacterium]
MTQDYSMFSVLQVLKEWKRAIIISVLSVGALAAILSLFSPNYYKAETVFYAANPDLADPSQLGYNDSPTYMYGGSDDLDRLFSIISSDRMADHLIKKFQLFSHYEFDSTGNEGKFKMREAFKSNFKLSKSKYGALVLAVEDKDPEIAAKIANEARNYAEVLAQKFIKDAQRKALGSYRHNIQKQDSVMLVLADSIRRLKENYNLIEANYQQRAFADELIKAMANKAEAGSRAQYYSKYESKRDSSIKYRAYEAGYSSKVNELQQKLGRFNSKISELKTAEQAYSRATDQSSIIRERKSCCLPLLTVRLLPFTWSMRHGCPRKKADPKDPSLCLYPC